MSGALVCLAGPYYATGPHVHHIISHTHPVRASDVTLPVNDVTGMTSRPTTKVLQLRGQPMSSLLKDTALER